MSMRKFFILGSVLFALGVFIVWSPSAPVDASQSAVFSVQTTPNDPLFSSQWNLKRVKTLEAWGVTTGQSNTVIAVIDTGVDIEHEDIRSKLWVNKEEIPHNGKDDDGNGYIDDYHGYNFLDGSADLTDFHGHGTGVASIAAAATNNNTGIAGINWQARIMVLKTLNEKGGGNFGDVAEALHYAADNGARVVNMSFGSAVSSSILREAVRYALSKGVVLVAATGNGGGRVMYPAAYDEVIGVGASGKDNIRPAFSNYGKGLDIVAPGVDIPIAAAGTFLTGPKNHSYALGSGTSFSSAHVTGLVSLLLAKNPNLTPGGVYNILVQSTTPIAGRRGYSLEYGYGLINFAKALGFKREEKAAVVLDPDRAPADGVSSIEVTLSLTNTFGQPDDQRSVLAKISGDNNIVNGKLVKKSQTFVPLGQTDSSGRLAFKLATTKAETKEISFYDGADYHALNISYRIIFDLPRNPVYQAVWVSQSPYPTLPPGDEVALWVELRNVGNVAWLGPESSLRGRIRLGTSHPRDRKSDFWSEAWPSSNRAAELGEDVVLPGEVGRFSFVIKAGKIGHSREYFQPVAEYVTWLNDLGIYWDINVTAGAPPAAQLSPDISQGYGAVVIGKGSIVSSLANKTTRELWVKVRNVGSKTWYPEGTDGKGTASVRLGTESPRDRNSIIATPDWFLPNRPLVISHSVAPGEEVTLTFPFNAPPTIGSFHESFRLVSEFVTWFGPVVTWNITRY